MPEAFAGWLRGFGRRGGGSAAVTLAIPFSIRSNVFFKMAGDALTIALASSSLPTTTNCSTSTGILCGSLPASFAPFSHSGLCCFQVFGSVISPSPCNPVSRIAFGRFAAVSNGIGRAGLSYSLPSTV